LKGQTHGEPLHHAGVRGEKGRGNRTWGKKKGERNQKKENRVLRQRASRRYVAFRGKGAAQEDGEWGVGGRDRDKRPSRLGWDQIEGGQAVPSGTDDVGPIFQRAEKARRKTAGQQKEISSQPNNKKEGNRADPGCGWRDNSAVGVHAPRKSA